MADLEGVDKAIAKNARLAKAAIKAAGQRAFIEAESMAAQMRRIAPRDDDPNNGQQVREHIRVQDGRKGSVSYEVIADAKDAKGRAKASRVELGHKAADGSHVEPSPFFYPVVRSSRKGVKRRIISAMRTAIKKELRR